MAVLLAVVGSMLLSVGLMAVLGWQLGFGVAAMVVGAELIAASWWAEGLPAKVWGWWERDAKPPNRSAR